jgi:16S rRNA (cytosine967-C5)-methyltransferase
MSQKLHAILVNGILDTLHAILYEGRYADKAIEYRLKTNKKWGARDRGFVSGTVYDIIRYLSLYTFLADNEGISNKHLKLERMFAAYYWQKNGMLPQHPSNTGLDESGLKARMAEARKHPQRMESYPDWIWNLVQADYPEDGLAILKTLNQGADVVLRCNTLKTTPDALQSKLHAEGFFVQVLPSSIAFKLDKRLSVFRSDSFKDGWFEVQDYASQQVIPFLQPMPGETIVDACAGAGGKTLHLAAAMQNKGRILALDVEEYKLAELKKRIKRAGAANVEIRHIDNNKTIKRLASRADRVLIDAPCSGSGTFRRNPDAKWKLTPERLSELVEIQADILQRYAQMVKPGGKLVYATCSVFRCENEQQTRKFLENNPAFSMEAESTLLPHDFGYDGFYMARFVRRKD